MKTVAYPHALGHLVVMLVRLSLSLARERWLDRCYCLVVPLTKKGGLCYCAFSPPPSGIPTFMCRSQRFLGGMAHKRRDCQSPTRSRVNISHSSSFAEPELSIAQRDPSAETKKHITFHKMDSPNFLFSIPLVGVEGRRGGRSFHPSETPITLCGPCYGGPQPSMLQQRLPYPRTTKAGNHCAEVFPPFTGGESFSMGNVGWF